MEELFLFFGDLALHPLAVHFATVLFPLAAIAVAIVATVPKLRNQFLGLSVIALALTIPFVFIAVQSGEALSEVYYEPEPHSEYGEMMMQVALATLAVGVLFWLSIKFNWPGLLAKALGFLVVSAAIGASAMTFVVGHSGAEATWGGKTELFNYEENYDQDNYEDKQQENSQSSTSSDSTAASDAANANVLSADLVASHSTKNDCWVIIDGGVYQLDGYMSRHPGGSTVLSALCGKDGTEAFSSQHARQALPKNELAKLLIGKLGDATAQAQGPASTNEPAPTQSATGEISEQQLISHSTIESCWVAVESEVYDLSGYAAEHPGGASQIQALCGTDATSAFSSQHGFVGAPANTLAAMKIGTLEAGASLPMADVVYGEGEDEQDDHDQDSDEESDED